MKSPLSHVVIDDGRFYLERSSALFDTITIDPPPPVEAAASSLLYSKEFYSTVKRHLRPEGILQQWFPGGEDVVIASVARALQESFPYVRAFGSVLSVLLRGLPPTRPSCSERYRPGKSRSGIGYWHEPNIGLPRMNGLF